MMKLLVVDDSELIRTRLLGMLQSIPGIDSIDTAATLAQTLNCVEQAHPTLLILDLHLPDGNAAQIIPTLKQLAPGMEIAVLTNDDSPFNRKRCLQAGADWFFDKPTEFEKALMLVQLQAANNARHPH
jgi:two-component system, OmpR family, response regulator